MRLPNCLLGLTVVECRLSEHESSAAVPRKIPKSTQLRHYQSCHRSATQPSETRGNASCAWPGGIQPLARAAPSGSSLCSHAKPQALCGRGVQRCWPHFTAVETKACRGPGRSNPRQGNLKEEPGGGSGLGCPRVGQGAACAPGRRLGTGPVVHCGVSVLCGPMPVVGLA